MIRMSLSGPALFDQVNAVGPTLSKAVTAAMAGATRGATVALRQQLTGSGYHFGRAVNAIRGNVWPRPPGHSIGAAGTVFAAGDSADRFLSAFAEGVTITPRGQRAMAIPLHDFRGFDRRLIGPKSSYWGGKLIFIPVKDPERGEIGILASKPDRFSTGRRWSKNTPLRAPFAKAAGDLIPQFVLVTVVRLPKILSPEDVMAEWAGKLPDLAAQAVDILNA